jgi:hypothetical protein
LKHGILLTLSMGPCVREAAAVAKPGLSKWPQDPDHDAKSHPAIANASIGRLKFYQSPLKGRDWSPILNLVAICSQKCGANIPLCAQDARVAVASTASST